VSASADRAAPPQAEPLRAVLSHYPTGVALITGVRPSPGDSPLGMVVGTFTSVSLDPALVGFLPARTSTTWPRIRASGRFCVNVLGADQQRVCEAFLRRDDDRWNMPCRSTPSGCLVLPEALAWFDCDLAAQTDAGDHWFVTGAVRSSGVLRSGPPLLYVRGRYATCTPHPAAVRAE
jgi:3-hydroxy-9,10-secoandrosta-1,3,5(10)-triene-9,17-dione monooxygenase reductase component